MNYHQYMFSLGDKDLIIVFFKTIILNIIQPLIRLNYQLTVLFSLQNIILSTFE